MNSKFEWYIFNTKDININCRINLGSNRYLYYTKELSVFDKLSKLHLQKYTIFNIAMEFLDKKVINK